MERRNEKFYRTNVGFPLFLAQEFGAFISLYRLTIDDKSRPTPKEMLAHPWIVNVMKQEVHISRWIRQVWGWPKPKRSKEKYVYLFNAISFFSSVVFSITHSAQPEGKASKASKGTSDPLHSRESNEL